MHEIELQMGLQSGTDRDKRGIHRLRLLALRMQSQAQKDEDKVRVCMPYDRASFHVR